jgi:CubicO group peptidase (beta-lactamase class C family)
MKHSVISLLVCVLVSCGPKTESVQSTFGSRLDSFLISIPDYSGVILIAEKGKPIYHKAFGYRNYHTGEKQDTNSIFELASLSKQFTAMAMMLLKKQRKLDYDDSIAKFFPALPYQGITIRHLLNHTSGLPDYQAIMDRYWDKSKVASNSDNIEYLIKYRPAANFSPGEKFKYSNTGYMLLASIAEKVSGADFVKFCNEFIFDPLEMESTDIRTRTTKQSLPQMAWGHLYDSTRQTYISADSFPEFNYTIWLGNRVGPGRVSSTASDLLKWDRALYNEKIIDRESLNEAFTPAQLTDGTLSFYGFGWQLKTDDKNGKTVFHTGDNPGYQTIIVRHIEKDKTVIILTNNDSPRHQEVVDFINLW